MKPDSRKGVIMVEIGEKDSKASVKITVLSLKPLREVQDHQRQA